MGEVDADFPVKTSPDTRNNRRRFSLRRDSSARRESSAGVISDPGLRFKSVCVDVSEKRILWDVSGHASPGHVLAVMGPSGSGKTTLLSTLASYLPLSSGSITLNGQRLSKRLKRKISYVLQADIFFANLTLKETLRYSALLRLPSELSFKEKLQKVDDIIESLSLQDCANTIIGDVLHRGLSGGEKKRANIGCELLTNPILLLLDEPTSGLDSSSALSLLETLKSLAKREQKTVVASIHQPSSQMYHMFDGLLLLAKGKVAYFGPAADAMNFFTRVGLECTLHYNPADYMLELVTNADTRKVLIGEDPRQEEMPQKLPWWKRWLGMGDEERQLPPEDIEMATGKALEVAEESEVKNVELVEYTASPKPPRRHPTISATNRMLEVVPEEVESEEGSEAGSGSGSGAGSEAGPGMKIGSASPPLPETFMDKRVRDRKWPTPWYWQFLVLIFRTFRQSGHVMLSKLNFIQMFAIACVASLVWFQIEDLEATIQDRYGLLFFSCTYWGFHSLIIATHTFPSERTVIRKERASGSYHLSAYYLAKTISELPIMLILPSAYIIIVYWAAGLNSLASFFGSWFVIILHCFVGQSFGLMLGATVMDAQKALVIAVVVMLSAMLLGGFYIQNLPSWIGWAQWVSFLSYSFEALLTLEFTPESRFACNTEASNYIVCNSTTATNTTMIPGTDVLEALNVDLPLYANILILIAFAFTFRLAAYISLRFLNRR